MYLSHRFPFQFLVGPNPLYRKRALGSFNVLNLHQHSGLDSKIEAIGRNISYPAMAEVIDMKGRTVVSGMVEAHVHIGINGEPDYEANAIRETIPMVALKASVYAKQDLLAGFTTLRTMGDEGYIDVALKRAIDSGLLDGPRLRVSGEALSITGGHGDFVLPPEVSMTDTLRGAVIVDSPDEARKAARYQLKMGADLIKLLATGGVLSGESEVGAAQLTEEEMRAAIMEAHKVGKKAAAHAHGSEGIKNAIRAGVDSIEHGTLLDDECIEMMLERGVFLVPTLSAIYNMKKYGIEGGLPELTARKNDEVASVHVQNFIKAYRAGVRIASGTDAGSPFNRHGEEAQELELMVQAGV